MPEFLTAKRAVADIEGIIKDARDHLYLVSAYFKVSETFMNRLRGASRYQVPITFVAREGATNSAEVEKLLTVPNLSLYTLKNLHAKCYLNEQRLVIASLNLYEESEKNWEMGVRFDADERVYAETLEEVKNIVSVATRISAIPVPSVSAVPAKVSSPPKQGQTVARAARDGSYKRKGACIRCGDDIAYNPDAPLCRDCWTIWAEFKNPDYPEHYCHDCGRKAKTSMSYPRCKPCFTGARA
ncbi:MAG TPA: phospholipase D-like domain-containing protein [Longimicrobium sp.]